MNMQINVIFANPEHPLWLKLTLAQGSTVKDAIANSGLLDQFPHLNFSSFKTGIFGKFAKLDKTLEPGDRVEIYQPITSDPKSIKRRSRNDTAANINA
ncbi:MAG: RnfH family protein [Amphritea sp.]